MVWEARFIDFRRHKKKNPATLIAKDDRAEELIILQLLLMPRLPPTMASRTLYFIILRPRHNGVETFRTIKV